MPFRQYLFLLIVFVFFSGCANPKDPSLLKYSEMKEMMGSYVKIDVCKEGLSEDKISHSYERVWQRLSDIAWRMNVYDERSDVAKVNNSNGTKVLIGQDTYALMQSAFEYTALTQGAFDITVRSLIDLWKKNAKNNTVPEHQEILNIQSLRGSGFISFEPDGTIINRSLQNRVDLGGIAQGYAVDEAVRIFREEGIRNFYIDVSGDIFVGGKNCEGQLWRIGIRDPRDHSNIIDIIELSDMAVTTSGNYEQFIEINGQRFSHIINPVTGYPQQDVVSATVIAPSTEQADALATALTVLGPVKSQRVIGGLGKDVASLIIVKDKTGDIIKHPSAEYKKFQLK